MEFLRSVEDDLRALSVEARKKHPVVKEAAERGIVKLRALREQYAAAVRESGESLPVSKLRSQELLRPFLLACNHADCGKTMILHALGAISYLMNKDAINPLDAPNILRVLAIQAVSPSAVAPDVHVKVLQTLLLTVTWRSCDLPEDMLASALIVCLQLTEHRNSTVRNAAQATLRQIVSLIFDKVADIAEGKEEDTHKQRAEGGGDDDVDWSQVAPPPPPTPTAATQGPGATMTIMEGGGEGEAAALATTPRQDFSNLNKYSGPDSPFSSRNGGEIPALAGRRSVERCAYYLIQDLCLICRGEAGTWIKHMNISPILGMELIEQILAQRPELFREQPVYAEVLRNQVCPLIVQTLRSEMDFPLLVRLMRTITTVLSELADVLVPQCEVILAMLFQLVASSEVLGASNSSSSGGGDGNNNSNSNSNNATTTTSGGGIGGGIASTANSLIGAAVAFGAGAVGAATTVAGRATGAGGGGSGGRLGLWTVMLALDVLAMVCSHSGLVQTAFQNYDLFVECTNVLAGMIKGLSRFVVEGSLSTSATASLHAAATASSWNAKGLPHLSRGFELMKETSPPTITEGEVLLNGAGCLLALVETIWGAVLDNVLGGVLRPAIPSASMYKDARGGRGGGGGEEGEGETAEHKHKQQQASLLHQMLIKEDVWQDILRFFTHLFSNLCHSGCDRLYENSLVGLERFCLTLGVLGVVPAENQMISLATKLAVPALSSELAAGAAANSNNTGASSSSLAGGLLLNFPGSPSVLSGGGGNAGGGGGGGGGGATGSSLGGGSGGGGGGGGNSGGSNDGVLTARHFKAIRCLLRLVAFLGNGLKAKSWETVVEGFDLLDACLYSATGGATSGSSSSAAAALAGSSLHIIPTGVERVGAVEEHKLANALRRFVTFSAILEDESLVHLVRAYISHGEALLQAEESAGGGGGGGGNRPGPSSSSNPSSSAFSLAAVMSSGGQVASSSSASSSSAGPGGSGGNAPGPGSFLGVANVSLERSNTSAAFVLKQLVWIAAFNIFRFELISAPVANHLSFVASTHNTALRMYAVASLADLVIKALGRNEDMTGVKEKVDQTLGYSRTVGKEEEEIAPLTHTGGGSILGSDVETIFHVKAELERLPGLRRPLRATHTHIQDEEEISALPQVVLLQPLAGLGASPYLDTREHVLNALYRVLQSCGHVLDKGWPDVFELLCAVAVSGNQQQPQHTRSQFQQQKSLALDASSSSDTQTDPLVLLAATLSLSTTAGTLQVPPLWGEACLPLAFRSLKLIVDDNLDSVPRQYLRQCITCIGAFGAQPVDVNVSLTAVGMVWTVADFISRPTQAQVQTHTQEMEKEKEKGNKSKEAQADEEGIWNVMLDELGRLALDPRPEVRNCAVNTLFSCFVGHGASFSLESWKGRVRAIMVLVQGIENKASSADDEEEGNSTAHVLGGSTLRPGGAGGGGGGGGSSSSSKKGPKVVMHHSRDTAQKQWSETRVLAMQGLGRLHRAFLRSLWSQPWYPELWTRTLLTAKTAISLGARAPNAEVALAGVGLLFMLLQLASKAGLAHGPLRAVVGMKVVDGALQHTSVSTEAMSPERRTAAAAAAALSISGQQKEAFEAAKVRLWEEAWVMLHEAVECYGEDQEGEIAAAFAMHLQTTYEGAKRNEFASTERMVDLLLLVEKLVEARKPVVVVVEGEGEGLGGGGGGAPSRASLWRPPVLTNQREVLSFLKKVQHEDVKVWEAIFATLTWFSMANKNPSGGASGSGGRSSSGSSIYVCIPVSAQFSKEAADCLTELYDQEHVPMAARAVAFEAIVKYLGGVCITCSMARRGGSCSNSNSNSTSNITTTSRSAWIDLLSRFAARKETSVSLTVSAPLPSVQTSGGLLKPVLRQGMAAAKNNRQQSPEETNKSKKAPPLAPLHLGRAWYHAFLVVEGYLVPWNVVVEGGQQQQQQQHQPPQDAVRPSLALLQEEAYTTVGVDLLRTLVDGVLSSLDMALRDGVVDQLGDMLVDVLLAQAALAGDFTPAPVGAEEEEGEGEEAAAAAREKKKAERALIFVFFKVVLEYLRKLLDALVVFVAEDKAAADNTPTLSTSSAAGAPSPLSILPQAIRSIRRLVSGLVFASRWVIERYLAESKSTDSPTQAYLLAESHVLILLNFLQTVRLPDWSLPSFPYPSPTAGENDGAAGGITHTHTHTQKMVVCEDLPAWVEPPGEAGLRKQSSAGGEGGRKGSVERSMSSDDHDDDDDLAHLLQGGQGQEEHAQQQQFCGHVFLLASPILACMGGSSSSVVRTAAMELLIEADLTATFVAMRQEIGEQRKIIQEANGEITHLRDHASRLSVSSVAGFF